MPNHWRRPRGRGPVEETLKEKVSAMDMHTEACIRLGLDPARTSIMDVEKMLKAKSSRGYSLPQLPPVKKPPRRHRGFWAFLDFF